MIIIASSTHAANLKGVPAQPNVPPPTTTTHQALSAPATVMLSPDIGTPITDSHLPLCNIPTRAWTPEIMTQSKQIEFQLLNAKIKQDKIKFKLREQTLRAKQATTRSNAHPPPSSNRKPRGSKNPLGHSMTPLQSH